MVYHQFHIRRLWPGVPYRRVYVVPDKNRIRGASNMVFQCQQCGECCSSMGEVIGIREKTGPWEYHVWYTITGEERQVWIDPDKRDLFSSQDILKKRPMACPFLRERSPGNVICTVHYTRPDLCRQYSCFRILVFSQNREKLGRVVAGSRYFITMDHNLRVLWDKEISPLTVSGEAAWEEQVDRILSAAGYRILRGCSDGARGSVQIVIAFR